MTDTDEQFIHKTIRLPPSILEKIDDQVKLENDRDNNKDPVTRSDIIRRAIKLGLKTIQLEANA